MAEKRSPNSGLAAADARPVASTAVRWGAWAGIAYVLAWLIGLFLAPSAPDPFGPRARSMPTSPRSGRRQ